MDKGRMERLTSVRAEIDDLNRESMRLRGELDGQDKRLLELEEECQKKFGVGVDGLVELMEKLDDEAEEALVEAERILKLKEE